MIKQYFAVENMENSADILSSWRELIRNKRVELEIFNWFLEQLSKSLQSETIVRIHLKIKFDNNMV